MACSQFEYVKSYEQEQFVQPNCWFVLRIDGRGFTEFTERHGLEKPNDIRGLGLMNKCAESVMLHFDDIVLAYGESDEYSFVFRRETKLWSRRNAKILTNVVSLFSSAYTFFWKDFFPDTPLQLFPSADQTTQAAPQLPSFDGRIVCYPTDENLRDYLSWRQADCHINNQYNTCFWALVHGGASREEACRQLKGTLTAEKNELLHSRFGVNYANIDPIFRKGTILMRPLPKQKMTRAEALAARPQQQAQGTVEPQQQKAEEDGSLPAQPACPASGSTDSEGAAQPDTAAAPSSSSGGGGQAAPATGQQKAPKPRVVTSHEDLIGDAFWAKYPHILGQFPGECSNVLRAKYKHK